MSNLSYNENHSKSFHPGDKVIAMRPSCGGWYDVGFVGTVESGPFKNTGTGKWLFRLVGRGGSFECGNFKLLDGWQPGEVVAAIENIIIGQVYLREGSQYIISSVLYGKQGKYIRILQHPGLQPIPISKFRLLDAWNKDENIPSTSEIHKPHFMEDPENKNVNQDRPNYRLQTKPQAERGRLNSYYRKLVKDLDLLPGWKVSIDYVQGSYNASSPKSQANRTKFKRRHLQNILEDIQAFNSELVEKQHLVVLRNQESMELETEPNHHKEATMAANQKFYIIWVPGATQPPRKKYEGEDGRQKALSDASEMVEDRSRGISEAFVLEAVAAVRPTRNVHIEEL